MRLKVLSEGKESSLLPPSHEDVVENAETIKNYRKVFGNNDLPLPTRPPPPSPEELFLQRQIRKDLADLGELKQMSCRQLKAMLEIAQASTSGRKDDLVARVCEVVPHYMRVFERVEGYATDGLLEEGQF